MATVTPLSSGGYLIEVENKGVLCWNGKEATLFAFNLFANGMITVEEMNKITDEN